MTKKYGVTLNDEELDAIEKLTRKGRVAARRLQRANILRLAHERYLDQEIADIVNTSLDTIARVRAKFVLGGLDWALKEEPRSGAPAQLDGKQEAFLIALACTTPPPGPACWTMQLLADQLLQSKVIAQEVSDETIRRALKKTNSNRGSVVNGAFRPSARNSSGAGTLRAC